MCKLDTVTVNGPEGDVLDWNAVDWRAVEDNVRRLRQRIFTATQAGDLKRVRNLGEAAVSAGRTDTFLGARYRRIARRRGKKKAIAAVGRTLLVIIWHLLADPNTRFRDLGADHYDRHVNAAAKKRSHVRQLEALGYKVTLEPAA